MENYIDQEFVKLQNSLAQRFQWFAQIDFRDISIQSKLINCLIIQNKIIGQKLLSLPLNQPPDSLQLPISSLLQQKSNQIQRLNQIIKNQKKSLAKQQVHRNLSQQVYKALAMAVGKQQLPNMQQVVQIAHQFISKLKSFEKQSANLHLIYNNIIDIYKEALQYNNKNLFHPIHNIHQHLKGLGLNHLATFSRTFIELSEQEELSFSMPISTFKYEQRSIEECFNSVLAKAPRQKGLFEELIKLRNKVRQLLKDPKMKESFCSCCQQQKSIDEEKYLTNNEHYEQIIERLNKQREKLSIQLTYSLQQNNNLNTLLNECQEKFKQMKYQIPFKDCQKKFQKKDELIVMLENQIKSLRNQLSFKGQQTQKWDYRIVIDGVRKDYQQKLKKLQQDKAQAQAIFDQLRDLVERQVKVIRTLEQKCQELKYKLNQNENQFKPLLLQFKQKLDNNQHQQSMLEHKQQALIFENNSLKEINSSLKQKMKLRAIDQQQKHICDLEQSKRMIEEENRALIVRLREEVSRNKEFEQRFKELDNIKKKQQSQIHGELQHLKQQIESYRANQQQRKLSRIYKKSLRDMTPIRDSYQHRHITPRCHRLNNY